MKEHKILWLVLGALILLLGGFTWGLTQMEETKPEEQLDVTKSEVQLDATKSGAQLDATKVEAQLDATTAGIGGLKSGSTREEKDLLAMGIQYEDGFSEEELNILMNPYIKLTADADGSEDISTVEESTTLSYEASKEAKLESLAALEESRSMERAKELEQYTESTKAVYDGKTTDTSGNKMRLTEKATAGSETELSMTDASFNAYNDTRFVQVDGAYLQDAVFIGNSRMQGLMLYSGFETQSLTYVGLNLKTFFSSAVFSDKTGEQAIRTMKFKKAYVKFGLNELGWFSAKEFAEGMGNVVDLLHEVSPGSIVYVMSVLPVAKEVTVRDNFTAQDIKDYNEALQAMCKEKGCVYLDVYGYFVNEEGYLPAERASDGEHLNANAVREWATFVLSHGIF